MQTSSQAAINASNHPAFDVLEQFCTAYSKRDLGQILNLFTDDAIMWGTGVDEYRHGKKAMEEQLLRDWSQSEAGSIMMSSNVVWREDNPMFIAAVFTAHITIGGTTYTFDHLRGNVTICNTPDGYKITFMHASFPDKTQAEGESFPKA